MTFLFPFIFISRLLINNRNDDDKGILNEFRINPILNGVFFNVFKLESYLLNYINFPFGSSLMCVAQKEHKHKNIDTVL